MELIEAVNSESLSTVIGGISTTLSITLVPSLLVSPIDVTVAGDPDSVPENFPPPNKQKPAVVVGSVIDCPEDILKLN
jgi:hypothetical protein